LSEQLCGDSSWRVIAFKAFEIRAKILSITGLKGMSHQKSAKLLSVGCQIASVMMILTGVSAMSKQGRVKRYAVALSV